MPTATVVTLAATKSFSADTPLARLVGKQTWAPDSSLPGFAGISLYSSVLEYGVGNAYKPQERYRFAGSCSSSLVCLLTTAFFRMVFRVVVSVWFRLKSLLFSLWLTPSPQSSTMLRRPRTVRRSWAPHGLLRTSKRGSTR